MICPYCQADNRDDAKYCNECGMPLSGMMAQMAAMVDGPEAPERDVSEDPTQRLPVAEEPDAPCEEAAPAEPAAEATSHIVDPADIPAIPVAGVNADEEGHVYEASDFMDEEPFDETPEQGDVQPSSEDFPQEEKAALEDEDIVDDYSDPDGFDEPWDLQGGSWNSSWSECGDSSGAGEEGSWQSEDTAEMPPASARTYPSQHENRGSGSQKPSPKERKGHRRKVVAVVLVALLAVVGVACAGVSYSAELWGGKTVPSVVGRTKTDAVYLLTQKGFNASVVEVKSDDTEGVVLDQSPSSGSRKDKGTVVEIQVSSARHVPEVVGLSRDEAKQLLKDEGIANVVIETVGSDEAEGTVLSVDPAVGTRTTESTAVTLTVAAPYSVPDVTGLSWEEANEQLTDIGYAVESVYVYDDEVEEGTVVSTDPAADEELALGETVTLSVALSRGDELESASFEYLANLDTIELSGTTYQISSVDGVSYEGDETIAFTVTARPLNGFGGEGSYAGERQVNGTIVWNSDDSIQAIY